MNQDLSKSNSKPTPALNGDEFDVLEALFKIETSSNKEILTDEQRGKLLMARQQLRSIGKSQFVDKNEMNLSGEVFVFSMRKMVEDLLINLYNYCSKEEWEKKDSLVKSKVISLFFYLVFGFKEEYIQAKINSSVVLLKKTKPKPTVSDEELALRSYRITKSLLISTDDYRLKYFTDDVWNSYTNEEKNLAKEQMFQNVFGLSSKDFGFGLFQEMKGWI